MSDPVKIFTTEKIEKSSTQFLVVKIIRVSKNAGKEEKKEKFVTSLR
jgi:hypothetical protein